MGWASGSELMGNVLNVTLKHIPAKKRYAVVKKLCEVFQAQDCDTLDELSDRYPLVAKALRAIDPEMYEDD
jgi:hypothetical protein